MKYPFMPQENNNDCGLACLAMLYMFYFKEKIFINEIRKNIYLTEIGVTILELKAAAVKYNILLQAYKITFQELTQVTFYQPLIIQIYKPDVGFHFIIIYKKKNQQWLIADPSDIEIKWIKMPQLAAFFSNIVLSSTMIKDKINDSVLSSKVKINYCSPFTIPNYCWYVGIIIINNLFLVTTFFLAQVFYKQFINQIIINNSLHVAVILLLSFIVINLLKILLEYIANIVQYKFYCYTNNHFVFKFHNKWFNSTPLQLQKYNNSEWLQFYQDISNIATMFCHNSLQIIINFITAIVVTIVLIKINVLLWIMTVSNGVLLLIVNFIIMLIKKPLVKNELLAKLVFQQQTIANQNYFTDAYYRNLHRFLQKKLQNSYGNHVKTSCKVNILTINNNAIINIIKSIINFLTIYLSMLLIFANKINLAQLIFISTISTYITNFFQNVGSIIMFWPVLIKSLARINNFMNSETITKKHKIITTLSIIATIEFKDCFFNIGNKPLFNNLNLKFTTNSIIIGPNGVGKTSLLLLIAQKWVLLKGEILINGKTNLVDFSCQEWQKLCIYLAPNPVIYKGTILENILSFAINNENLKSYHSLGCEEILHSLSLYGGYYCQDYGNNLSQGQKQVIAFLSLFFNNWKVILLDESCSNISADLKTLLIKLLLKHFPKTVIIYTGHDVSLLKLFSNIINLENNFFETGHNYEIMAKK